MEGDLGSLAGGEQQAAHEIIACSGSRESQEHPSLYSKEQHQEAEGGDYKPLPTALLGARSYIHFWTAPTPQYKKDIVNWSEFSRKPHR